MTISNVDESAPPRKSPHDNHTINDHDDPPLTLGGWQTHFRSQIELARCAVMTHDEREQVVRFVRDHINLIFYTPSEYPSMFEEVGLVGVRANLAEDCEPMDLLQGEWGDD